MRLRYFSFVILLGLFSCSKEKQDENLPPNSPQLLFPADKEECLYSPLSLEWTNSPDPDGDSVSYTIEIAETPGFEALTFFTNTIENTAPFNLQPGTIYYWRVKAIDIHSNSSQYSQVRSFFTQPEINYNHFPSVPQVESPQNGSNVSGSKTLLKWNSHDVDGDALKYDLYFSTENPPTLFKENLDTNSYEVALESAKTYYWKIAAKDGKGAKSFGPVWKFIN